MMNRAKNFKHTNMQARKFEFHDRSSDRNNATFSMPGSRALSPTDVSLLSPSSVMSNAYPRDFLSRTAKAINFNNDYTDRYN